MVAENKTDKKIDIVIIICVLFLFIVGVSSVYSAASGVNYNGWNLARRQLIWGGLSVVAFFAVLKTGYRKFLEYAYPIYGAVVAVLLIVLLFGLTAKGAQSWLNIGRFRLQPSEFGKIALSLALARTMAYNSPSDIKTFSSILALAAASGMLVVIQPDMGSALVYGVITFVGLFAAGAKRRYLLSLVGSGLIMLPMGWQFLKSYQKKRILVFLDPTLDPLGAGYNVIQSRIAVGSGQIWGKGFLNGTQSKLGFLPEPHTDFIFSVLSEEWGFLGAFAVLFVFSVLLYRIISIGIKTKDVQGKILVATLSAWIWFQVFECVGMSIGILPVTGVPLPLLSYGGSALLANSIAFALIVSVGILDETERQQYE